MKTSRWVKYDAPSRLWIQSNKRIYFYWYSFLQLAEQDPTRKVNWKLYEGWGGADVVLNTKFDAWWNTHWKDLFGIPKEGDEPKFPLSTKKPKEQGLRLALLIYERRGLGDMWTIAKNIARYERRTRKRGLTVIPFGDAFYSEWKRKDPTTRSVIKRNAQSRTARYMHRAEELLDSVCEGVFP